MLCVGEVPPLITSAFAAYKIPRRIEFRDELPKGGKLQILRTELRDQELAKLKSKAKV